MASVGEIRKKLIDEFLAGTSYHAGSQIRPELIEEFKRRENDRGLQYNNPVINGNRVQKGPQTAWVRMMSNARGFIPTKNKGFLTPAAVGKSDTPDGFIMESLRNFDDDYGFNLKHNLGQELPAGAPKSISGDNVVTIGKAPNGDLHQINAQFFKHRPAPGITSINIEHQGSELYGKLRRITVNFKCFSPEQLDYLDNYFFNPSISCFVDWGWTNVQLESIVNIKGEGNLIKLGPNGVPNNEATSIGTGVKNIWSDPFEAAARTYFSNGNYDCQFGILTNFNWTYEENQIYNCSVTIQSPLFLAKSLNLRRSNYKCKDRDTVDKMLKSGNLRNFFSESKMFSAKDIIRAFPGSEPIPNEDEDVWIRFDEIIKFFNSKFSAYASFDPISDQKSDAKSKGDSNKEFVVFKINIDDSILAAHPSIKSTDPKVLIIPNSTAPSGVDTDEGSKVNLAKFIAKVLSKNISRLNDNSNSSPVEAADIAFPTLSSPSGRYGYEGKLSRLFVHQEVIKSALEATDNPINAMEQILQEISEQASGMWELQMKQLHDLGAGSPIYTIIDLKHHGSKRPKQLKDAENHYSFKVGTDNSIVESFELNVDSVGELALNAMFAGNIQQNEKCPSDPVEEEDTGDSSTLQAAFMAKCDRFYDKLRLKPDEDSENVDCPTDEVKDGADPIEKKLEAGETLTIEEKKKLQDGKKENPAFFPVIFKDSNDADPFHKGKISDVDVIFLAEADGDKIKKLMAADKTKENRGVYEGVVPQLSCKLTILGIAGIRYLDVFSVPNLPSKYLTKGVWKVTGISHTIDNSIWKTDITGMFLVNSFE